MLNERQLSAYIDEWFTHTLFRLETHDHLEVESDGDDFERYRAGLPGPDMARKGAWMDVIRREVAEGKHTYRVHVVRSPLSDYLRYVCEWGYAYNEQAGEHVGIIDLAERAAPPELIIQDFWLIDDQHLVLMHYDDRGRYLGANPITHAEEVARYRACAHASWAAAVPFRDYWQPLPP